MGWDKISKINRWTDAIGSGGLSEVARGVMGGSPMDLLKKGISGNNEGDKPPAFDYRQPQGLPLRKQALEFGGIDPAEMNQSIALAGEQSRQQNVAGYNAAIASQRGVNPTAAVTSMGQNLSSANADAGAQTQALQAQTTWGAQQSNQNMMMDYYKTLGQFNQNADLGAQQADTARRGQNIKGVTDSLGPIGGIIGGVAAAFSDERLKEPVNHDEEMLHHYRMGRHEEGGADQMAQQGPKSTEQFMDTLKPQEFEYRPGTVASDGQQPHIGVMAQDLEKTPQGKSVVNDTPEGKVVDTSHLAMMLAATVGDLHQRLSRLEGGSHGQRV